MLSGLTESLADGVAKLARRLARLQLIFQDAQPIGILGDDRLLQGVEILAFERLRRRNGRSANGSGLRRFIGSLDRLRRRRRIKRNQNLIERLLLLLIACEG